MILWVLQSKKKCCCCWNAVQVTWYRSGVKGRVAGTWRKIQILWHQRTLVTRQTVDPWIHTPTWQLDLLSLSLLCKQFIFHPHLLVFPERAHLFFKEKRDTARKQVQQAANSSPRKLGWYPGGLLPFCSVSTVNPCFHTSGLYYYYQLHLSWLLLERQEGKKKKKTKQKTTATTHPELLRE